MHIFGKNNETAPVPEASGGNLGWGRGAILESYLVSSVFF